MDVGQIEEELRAIRRSIEAITLSTAARAAFSPSEAAAKLGVSAKTVQRMIARGELATSAIGKRRLVSVAEIERLVAPKPSKRGAPLQRPTRYDAQAVVDSARAARRARR